MCFPHVLTAWGFLRIIFLVWGFGDTYHFWARSRKIFQIPLFCLFLWWAQIRGGCSRQQSGLKIVFRECSKYNGYISFLGHESFCLHMLNLGNKGQWVVLEWGQMAGFFPGSRLLALQRRAPGCPAAGLSGSLSDDLVTPTPQRWRCMCALYLRSGKECGYSQWICIYSAEKMILRTKCYRAVVCVLLYIIQTAKILLQIFKRKCDC